ncbi:MAG: hypothetical protein JST68_27955 [Bacteroidetes bacterium]|nr:hypothetical protein [Bacteroidota bacterium]
MRRGSRPYQKLLFTLGVILFLLRPFTFYFLIGNSGSSADGQRINQLMQRTIKKKEDHHEPEAEALSESGRHRSTLRLLTPKYLWTTCQSFWNTCQSLWHARKTRDKHPFTASVFLITPDNHHYRSSSLFRI